MVEYSLLARPDHHRSALWGQSHASSIVRIGRVDAIISVEALDRARAQRLVAQSHGALAVTPAIPLGHAAGVGKWYSRDRDGRIVTADHFRTANTGAEGKNCQKQDFEAD